MNDSADRRLPIERIKALSAPLSPLPTGIPAAVPNLGNLRAVLFDAYGTLFISGSGDISLANHSENSAALVEALQAAGLAGSLAAAAKRGARLYVAEIERRHAAMRAEGASFPEVEIREVWQAVLARLKRDSLLDGEPTRALIERLAVEYECRINPVWPMPDALATIGTLRDAGILLGVASNAQFFTPLLFEAFWGKPLNELGFEPDLCFWSYETLEAKPGEALFRKAADALAMRGVAPGQTLYVGNDMRNDVLPAASAGFRTALFAGDKRSLRLRENDPECANAKPDAIITALGQTGRLVGIRA